MSNRMLPLRRPDEKLADPNTLRLDDCLISAAVSLLRRPETSTADTGRLRLGDCMISAQLANL